MRAVRWPDDESGTGQREIKCSALSRYMKAIARLQRESVGIVKNLLLLKMRYLKCSAIVTVVNDQRPESLKAFPAFQFIFTAALPQTRPSQSSCSNRHWLPLLPTHSHWNKRFGRHRCRPELPSSG